ncbi:SWIM zinc finger family protein [Ruminococcus flavefaciens]|uniref:SWIM zinc finger protein n=1 Tax=Ruminococcus flavefaciens TaxID=1265 RepID=A0A315XSP4_RUMFL|nr:SWIM zinc finger family protein [Ruminococcus flavefaciens]PWJ09682.1 SWIM zinc finger protein [Ruminococcus flavefaciens]SSA52300.1 SWIM zinc finger [Ruminococcus flavefaciens]
MDWKKLFNPIIIERGYDYYRNGNAEILSSMADEVNAVVSGSDDYEGSIYLSDGEIDDIYCDCPYASDGNNCKHMAAVLYLFEDLQNHSNPHYTDIESLIADTSSEQLKKFLINAMRYLLPILMMTEILVIFKTAVLKCSRLSLMSRT